MTPLAQTPVMLVVVLHDMYVAARQLSTRNLSRHVPRPFYRSVHRRGSIAHFFFFVSRNSTFFRTAYRSIVSQLVPSETAGDGVCTNWVVFHHAHHRRGSRSLEGVEEARHGHGDEADMHQTSLG